MHAAATSPAGVAARLRAWASEGPQGPVTLEVHPTLRCNLACGFCDAADRRPGAPEIPPGRLLSLVEEAAALDVRRAFVLGGGEPLAAAGILDLLRAVKARGLEGILGTNGTLLGADLARDLVAWGWDEVQVSIDGPTAPIHDALRGVPGAFRRTVEATCRLRRLRDAAGATLPRIALHAVVTRANCRHLADLVRLAAALGAFRVDFDALVAWRPGQRALDLDADARAAVPALARGALVEADRLGLATTLPSFLEAGTLDRGTRTPPAPAPAAPDAPLVDRMRGAPCLKAWHCLVVAADGRVSPCCVLQGQGGSVLDAPLAEAWRRDPFLERVRASMLAGVPLERCRECSENILGHERLIRACL